MSNFLENKIGIPMLFGALAFMVLLFGLVIILSLGKWLIETVAKIPAQFWAELPLYVLGVLVTMVGFWALGMGLILIVRWIDKRRG